MSYFRIQHTASIQLIIAFFKLILKQGRGLPPLEGTGNPSRLTVYGVDPPRAVLEKHFTTSMWVAKTPQSRA